MISLSEAIYEEQSLILRIQNAINSIQSQFPLRLLRPQRCGFCPFFKLTFSLRSIFPQGYFYCTAEKSRIFPKEGIHSFSMLKISYQFVS